MHHSEALFHVGQLLIHKKFGYRGVVYDVDPVFSLSEDWYGKVAKSKPPKNRPWYHILVHGSAAKTYVAERHLEPEPSPDPIQHPQVDFYFRGLYDGVYQTRKEKN